MKGIIAVIGLLVCLSTIATAEVFPQQPEPARVSLDAGYASHNPPSNYPYGADQAYTDFNLYAQGVSVFDFTPTWAHLSHGNDLTNQIEIHGCGFRAHTDVVCVFEWKTTSISAWIVDDNTIICILPERTLEELPTLPQYQRLDLVFDGEFYQAHANANDWQNGLFNYIYVGQFRWGPEISCSNPIQPTAGYTNGGETLTIFGEGFQDPIFNTSNLNLTVYFDDEAVVGTVTSDSTITCSTPSVNNLYENRIVKVVWWSATDEEVYLVSNTLFFYGPEFYELFPSCVNYDGSATTMTITGARFDDPLIKQSSTNYQGSLVTGNTPSGAPRSGSVSSQVRLEVHLSKAVTWTNTYFRSTNLTTSGGSTTPVITLEAIGSVSSSTTITFSPPNFMAGVSTADASSFIDQRNVLSTQNAEVKNVRFNTNYGLAAYPDFSQFFRYGSYVTSVEDRWFGGQSNWCIEGCFSPLDITYLETNGTIFHDTIGTVGNAADQCRFSTRDATATSFCCTTDRYSRCSYDSGNTATQDFFLATNASGVATVYPDGVYNWAASDSTLNGLVGPQIDTPEIYRTTVTSGQIDITGSYFGYQNYGSPNDWLDILATSSATHNCATNLVLASASTNTSFSNRNTSQIEIIQTSDSTLTVKFGVSCFGETITITELDFVDVFSTTDCQIVVSETTNFGPTCSIDDASINVPLQNPSLNINVPYGADYTPVLLLCDADKPGNIQTGSGLPSFPSSLPVDPITGLDRNRCYIGTTESFDPTSPTSGPTGFVGGTQVVTSITSTTTTGKDKTFTYNGGSFVSSPDRSRGRRVWGQQYDATLVFNTLQDQIYYNSASFVDNLWADFDFYFNTSSFQLTSVNCVDNSLYASRGITGSNANIVNVGPCYSLASIQCGTFRFGPVTDSISPCQGPAGTADNFQSTAVTVGGLNINDNWPAAQGTSFDSGSHLVSFGTLFGTPASTGSSTINFNTVWGANSNAQFQYSASVFFDTCNITWSTNLIVHWGPVLDDISPAFSGDETADGDIWGFFPYTAEAGYSFLSTSFNYVTLSGYGFFYGKNYAQLTSSSDTSASRVTVASGIRVTVDGVPAGIVDAALGDVATQYGSLTVNLPPRPWGTTATVCISWDQENCATNTYGEDYFGEDVNEDVWAYYEDLPGGAYLNHQRAWWQNEIQSVNPPHAPLCYPTAVHYDLKIVGDNTDSKTSAFPTVSVGSSAAWTCYGCNNMQNYPEVQKYQLKAYFGGFPSVTSKSLPASSLGDWVVPQFKAEFNTDVPISFHLVNSTLFGSIDDCNYDEWSVYRVYTDITHHFGPVCDGPAASQYFLNGRNLDVAFPLSTPTNNFWLTSIGGRNFQDCTFTDCADGTATQPNLAVCSRVPQVEQPEYPYSAFSATTNYGSSTCIHREVQVQVDLGDGTWVASTPSANGTLSRPISLGLDTLGNWEIPFDTNVWFTGSSPTPSKSNSDSQINIWGAYASPSGCRTVNYRLFFPDAVVTGDNNLVYCANSAFFGPKVSGVVSTATLVTYGNKIYGWDNVTGYYAPRGVPSPDQQDYLLTVTGSAFNDPAIGSFVLNFDTQPSSATSGNTHQFNSAGKITIVVPTFQTTFNHEHLPLSYSFSSTSSSELTSCGGDLIQTFHYGPEILFSSTDDCSSSHCGTSGTSTPSSSVEIYVRGSQCCGYRTLTVDAQQHVCLMGYNTNTALNAAWFTFDLWYPTSITTGSISDVITCNTPNPLSPSLSAGILASQRLVNFGILWGNANGTTSRSQVCGSSGQICNFTAGTAIGDAAARSVPDPTVPVNRNPGPFYWADSYASDIDDSHIMDMCFRTKIAYDTQYVRYSGLTRLANGTDVPQQVAYTVSCPEPSSQYQCQFVGASSPSNFADVSSTVTCTVPQFQKNCGSASDQVYVAFNLSSAANFGNSYPSTLYTQNVFTLRTGLNNARPELQTEGQTKDVATVSYGPVLVSGPAGSTSQYLAAYSSIDGVDRFIGQPAFFDPDQLGQKTPKGNPIGYFDHTRPYNYPSSLGYQSYDAPPNVISLTVQNAADWFVDTGDKNKGASRPWGSEQYICVFSSDLSDTPVWRRRSENCASDAICSDVFITTVDPFQDDIYSEMPPDLVPQQLISPPLGIQSTTFVSALSTLNYSSPSDDIDVLCQVPVNNWGQEGYIGVLLDPHIDLTLTQHFAPNHINFARPLTALSNTQIPDFSVRENVGYWHFTPYITDVSKDWAAPNSLLESVTVYGGDFCSYGRVLCTFTSKNASGEVFDSVQGDILSDSMVICQLPPYESPQDVSISLTFCAGQTYYSSIANNASETTVGAGCACAFGCDDTPNSVGAIDFQFTGVTAFAPSTGPVQGYTNITFTGVGFDKYWNLTCSFGDSAEVPVIFIDASHIQCITPPAANLLPGTVELHVIGYYAQDPKALPETPFLYAQDLGCTSFTYGLPAVSSILPASLEFAESFATVKLTINGQYFNGGVPTDGDLGSYHLLWQHGEDPKTDLATNPTPADYVINYQTYCVKDLLVDSSNPSAYTYQLICDVPDVDNAQWYPLRVTFSDLPTIQDSLYLISGQLADLTGFDTDVHRRLKEVDWCQGCSGESARTKKWKTLDQTPVIRDIFGGWVYVEADNAIGYIEPSDTSKTPGSIVCRFEPITGNTFSHRTYFISGYSNGTYIICDAPARPEVTLYLHEYYNNLTTNKNTRQNSRPNYMNSPLAISLDSGYTWSNSIDIPYKRVSSSGVLAISFFMSLAFLFTYYFF